MALLINHKDNSIQFDKIADPVSPPAGTAVLYFGIDGNLYLKDEAGAAQPVGSTPGLVNSTFELAGSSYDTITFDHSTEGTNGVDITFSPDGLNMYLVVNLTGVANLFQYPLSTAWDITSAGAPTSFDLGIGLPESIAFNDEGTKLFATPAANSTITEYTLSTAWDVTSLVATGTTFVGTGTPNHGIDFSRNGLKLYVATALQIKEYDLITPWDISSPTDTTNVLNTSGEDLTLTGFKINDDGTSIITVGTTSDAAYQYTLTTPYDLSTGGYASKLLSIALQNADVRGIGFSTDLAKMFTIGQDASSLVDQFSTAGPDGLPIASKAIQGIIEVATQAEVDIGLENSLAVTPATLTNFAGLGATTVTIENFVDTVDYTSGTTTELILAIDPKTENNISVIFDGVTQHHDQYSIVGTTITFTTPIPLETASVEVVIGSTFQVGVPAAGSVTLATLATEVTNEHDSFVALDGSRLITGALDFANNDIDNAKTITFDSEIANTGTGAQTVDFALGQKQRFTITGATTITILPPAGISNLVLKLIDADINITWATTILWADGVIPTWSTTGTDILSLYYDGTNFYGMAGIGFA